MEASQASGRHIPMIVENVKGAQDYVGTAKYHFGAMYLWGDVPLLMPNIRRGSNAQRDAASSIVQSTDSMHLNATAKNV